MAGLSVMRTADLMGLAPESDEDRATQDSIKDRVERLEREVKGHWSAFIADQEGKLARLTNESEAAFADRNREFHTVIANATNESATCEESKKFWEMYFDAVDVESIIPSQSNIGMLQLRESAISTLGELREYQFPDETKHVDALDWAEYLAAHSKRVFAPALFGPLTAARELARHIKKGDLPDVFQAKFVYDKGWAGLTESVEVGKALDVLENYGWVCSVEQKTKGRPRTDWHLHPDLRQSFSSLRQ